MRRACAVLVAATLAGGCGGDEDLPVGDMVVEVLAYDYRLELATRAAAAELSLRVVEPGDCLRLPMRAADLAAVRLDGEGVASGSLIEGVLTACGRGWHAGDELSLSAEVSVLQETWGDSQVGYSVWTDTQGEPFSYLVSWIGGCDRFGPCDNDPGRFARYRFEVSHDQGTEVLCPGTIDAGATVTVCEFDHGGGPTYSTFGLAASPSWQTHDLGLWGDVAVTLYDMPDTGIAQAFDDDLHGAFFAFMQNLFGPYPYGDELRFAVGPTYWNGFEHPGNIVLSDQLARISSLYADPLAHTVNHEIAHQWAGDQTTLRGVYDFVWKEAMAEYLTFVFEEEKVSAAAGRATARAWRQFARGAAYYPVPGERPPLLDYYGHVYGPGPLIFFRQLEALFDRGTVLSALQSLLGTERAIGVDDVRAALEVATGADLGGYFSAWVHGEGRPQWPEFRVTVSGAGEGDVEVQVEQVAPAARLMGCAFAIELHGEDAQDSVQVWFDLGVDGTRSLTRQAAVGFPITGHRFDPGAHCLAFETTAGLAVEPFVHPWRAPSPPVPYRPAP